MSSTATGIHHLNSALGIAGDDSVADGGQSGAQLLLGLKDLFGAASEDIERCLIGAGDGVQAVAGEQADKDADAESEDKEQPLHVADLALPELRCVRAALLGVVGGVGDVLADSVHHRLSAQIQIDVAGLSAGADGGNDGQGEGVLPDLMLVDQIVDVVLLDRVQPGKRLHPVELGLQTVRGVEIGLEEAGVGGVLVAAKTGLLVRGSAFRCG